MWLVWGGDGAYRVLVGKPEEKRPLARPKRRWMSCVGNDIESSRGFLLTDSFQI